MVVGRGARVDELVGSAADPAAVRLVLERLGPTGRVLTDDAMAALVAVAGASDSLGALLVEDPGALGVLDDLDGALPLDGTTSDALRVSHRRAFLRIAARDLLDRDDLETTMAALSGLATELVDRALELAEAPSLVVIGMGKFGAGELNFVSDIDVAFLSEGDPGEAQRAARRFLGIAGRCARIDVDLRPEGRDGPLVRSLESWRGHWERWASAWEFQALLKAATVAGPTDQREAFDAAAADALWQRSFGAEELRDIRRLKGRVEADIEARGLGDREVKRAPGGIRDIEFSTQLLQLVHGHADPALRVRATLPALDQLVLGGYVDPDEARVLATAYRFLRDVEHRLQLVAERQTHLVPEDRTARRRLARTLGYRGTAEAGPTEHFDRDLATHRLAVRRVHESWYFRPLLDAFAAPGPGRVSATEMTATRLGAFGFRDPARTEQAVRELSQGLTRSSRLMRHLLPLVLDWLSAGPDPDLGLLGLRRLATGEQRTMRLVGSFRDSAETARQLCMLLSTAPVATEILEENPDLVERLDDASRLQTADRPTLLASAWDAVGWRDGLDEQQAALRRWFRRHLLGIVARDVAGAAETGIGQDLAVLVEAVIETATRLAAPPMPFAVIGMGRLGGRELSYASDVDLVFVDGGGDRAEAERAAAAITRLVNGATPATRIVAVDVDLRPEGRQGPLARSLDSYTAYLERWAQTWERQALLRARPVAGDGEVGRGVMALVDRHVRGRPPDADQRREIRRIKARVESERIPRGPVAGDPQPWRHYKLGPGGLADIEWTVQLHQWSAGVRPRGTMAALAGLVDAGRVAPDDAAVLAAAHEWCDRLRNRTWLCLGQGDVLPQAIGPLSVLARSSDLATTELVDAHRRHLRRSRRVVEELFYGGD